MKKNLSISKNDISLQRHKNPNDNAGIAQLVEHDLAKVGVASSSLVSRSFFLFIRKQISPGGGIGRRAGLKIL